MEVMEALREMKLVAPRGKVFYDRDGELVPLEEVVKGSVCAS